MPSSTRQGASKMSKKKRRIQDAFSSAESQGESDESNEETLSDESKSEPVKEDKKTKQQDFSGLSRSVPAKYRKFF